MHYWFSTIISLLLSPLNWIIVLLIAAFFIRRPKIKRYVRMIALAVFLVFSNPVLLNWYADNWQPSRQEIPAGKIYSCGIVAGGFASQDGQRKGYFNATADRFIQALKLYKLGTITHILVSGGNGKRDSKDFREGAWVENELLAMGVPDSAVLVEDRSNNTADNALNAKRIFDSTGLKPPYLLISSAHHLPRAMLLFEKMGVRTEPFPCNYIAGNSRIGLSSFIPRPGVLYTWEVYFKETFGYTWYKFFKK